MVAAVARDDPQIAPNPAQAPIEAMATPPLRWPRNPSAALNSAEDIAPGQYGTGPTLLDIREKWEWDIAHIEAATRVTPENNQAVLGALDPSAEIVLIDWKQDRSPSFQRWLFQRGFSNVKCLEGGIDTWSERVDTRQSRYDIDEDDGYRYEDILSEDGQAT